MPFFTLQQYNDLLASIASGASSVSYEGKSVTNRSFDEQMRLLALMARDLGINPQTSSTRLAAHSRGFYGGFADDNDLGTI